MVFVHCTAKQPVHPYLLHAIPWLCFVPRRNARPPRPHTSLGHSGGHHDHPHGHHPHGARSVTPSAWFRADSPRHRAERHVTISDGGAAAAGADGAPPEDGNETPEALLRLLAATPDPNFVAGNMAEMQAVALKTAEYVARRAALKRRDEESQSGE